MNIQFSEKMPYQTILFDLDGTLIDSVQDIGDAMNHVLAAHGFPQHDEAAYRRFIGRGLKNLCLRAFPADLRALITGSPDLMQVPPERVYEEAGGADVSKSPSDLARQQAEALWESCFQELMAYYRSHCVIHTRLYPGIRVLLEELHKRRFQMGVISNKADEITRPICDILGIRPYFRQVMGHQAQLPHKPDPTAARLLLDKMDCHDRPEDILYVGDSGVDMLTAANAGFTSIGVTWGFRPRQELVDSGARHLADTPADILAIAMS